MTQSYDLREWQNSDHMVDVSLERLQPSLRFRGLA
jgi:hypothetical protein